MTGVAFGHESSSLVTFLTASTLIIIVPGPATLFVIAASRERLPHALRAIAGIVLGDIVLIGLSAFGLAVLLTTFPRLELALRLLGAAYLLWLAVSLLVKRSSSSTSQGEVQPRRSELLRGLALTLTNPKPLLFFGTFFPLFLPIGAASTLGAVLPLGLIFEVINVTYLAIIAATVSAAFRLHAPSAGSLRMVNVISGAGLLLCAVYLLAESGISY